MQTQWVNFYMIRSSTEPQGITSLSNQRHNNKESQTR